MVRLFVKKYPFLRFEATRLVEGIFVLATTHDMKWEYEEEDEDIEIVCIAEWAKTRRERAEGEDGERIRRRFLPSVRAGLDSEEEEKGRESADTASTKSTRKKGEKEQGRAPKIHKRSLWKAPCYLLRTNSSYTYIGFNPATIILERSSS